MIILLSLLLTVRSITSYGEFDGDFKHTDPHTVVATLSVREVSSPTDMKRELELTARVCDKFKAKGSSLEYTSETLWSCSGDYRDGRVRGLCSWKETYILLKLEQRALT